MADKLHMLRARLKQAHANTMGATGAAGPVGPVGVSSSKQRSDTRFRSFAERFMVERAKFFRADAKGLQEDIWKCVLDAKSAYAMIERVGRSVAEREEEGLF